MADFVPYKLRATIAVHSNDVRAVEFTNENQVLTTSRDLSAKLTLIDDDECLTTDLFDGQVYLNSAATDGETAFIGAINGLITSISLNNGEQKYFMGHEANVSSLGLHTPSQKLVSGSWDTTVRVWNALDPSVNPIVLEGHSQYVWDAKFINENTVISASADRTIRVWDISSRSLKQELKGHTDVVRSLLVLSDQAVLSAANDGTIRRWDLKTGQCVATWQGHTSFVYSLAQLSADLVASSGEDRTVRIWSIASGQCLQTILLPSISQWHVASNELGELAVGSSDNTARVFTPILSRQANADVLSDFETAVKNSALGETEISESQISSADVLQHPGQQEGQVVIVRDAQTHKLVAHQYTSGKWYKVGDVVGANQASGSKKQSYNGQQYDYVFDVDIEDGKPPLKLPFNNSDNPYIVAEKFVMENNLPSSYNDQVVKFLITNSEAKTLGTEASTGSTSAGSAPSTGTSTNSAPLNSADIPSVLRYNQPVFIRSLAKEPLLKALTQNALGRGEDISVYRLDSILNSLPSASNELLNIAVELHGKWSDNIDSLLPVYDLLRIALPDVLSLPYSVVWAQLISALDAQVPKHCMLAVRGVANLVGNPTFDGASAVNQAMLTQALQMISQVAVATPSFSKALATALATLILNLAVRNPAGTDFSGLIKTAAPKIVASLDTEASYRLLLGVGLRSVAGEGHLYESAWFNNAPSEPRIAELLKIVKPRIN